MCKAAPQARIEGYCAVLVNIFSHALRAHSDAAGAKCEWAAKYKARRVDAIHLAGWSFAASTHKDHTGSNENKAPCCLCWLNDGPSVNEIVNL